MPGIEDAEAAAWRAYGAVEQQALGLGGGVLVQVQGAALGFFEEDIGRRQAGKFALHQPAEEEVIAGCAARCGEIGHLNTSARCGGDMRLGNGVAQQVSELVQGAGLQGGGRRAQFVEQLQKARQCLAVFCAPIREGILYAERAEGVEQVLAEGGQVLAALQGLEQVKERG